jgi:hypothetical protein
MLLEAIYEQDFHDGSYGFRPGRSPHDALHELREWCRHEGIGWIVDADVRGKRHVRPHVEAGNLGKIVAIDVDTRAFEVVEDTLTASQRLLSRYPDAQIWCIRIGHRGVHRFGWKGDMSR